MIALTKSLLTAYLRERMGNDVTNTRGDVSAIGQPAEMAGNVVISLDNTQGSCTCKWINLS